jgi:hypothetical protein
MSEKDKRPTVKIVNLNWGYQITLGNRVLYEIEDDIQGPARSWSCTKELIRKMNALNVIAESRGE